jgi:hypothetical protein
MKITLAQVDSVLGDIEANLERAEQVITEAVEESTDLVVFPELHLTGYSIGTVDHDLSVRPDDERLLRLSERAGSAGIVLGFVEAGPGGMHTYNSAAYYRNGALVHVHRKLYLPTYLAFEERKHFTPGPTMRAFPDGEAGKPSSSATMRGSRSSPSWPPRTALGSSWCRPRAHRATSRTGTSRGRTGVTSPVSTAGCASCSWCS